MNPKGTSQNAFSSVVGFLFTAVGFAVGIGSIWRFPYVLGANGGAIFLLVYVFIIVLIGVPLLTAELSMGFKSQRSPVLAYKYLAPGKKLWPLAGYLHLFAALMLLSYTAPIYGWILGYLWNSAAGTFVGMSGAGIGAFFDRFTGNIPLAGMFAAINIAVISLVVSGGVRKGVEAMSKILLPVLGVIMLVLIIAGLRLPGSEAGVDFLFRPNPGHFTLTSLHSALGQALCAVGIGMLASMVFGSYIKNPAENLLKNSLIICFSLIFAGLMAGMMIFPALFASGCEASSSVGLVFLTVPLVFGGMYAGRLLGTLFFFGFYIAAVTAAAGLSEAVVGMLMDQFRLSRKKAVVLIAVFMAVLGWFSLPAGNFFRICDMVTNNYVLIIGAFAIAVFVGWVWGTDSFLDAANVRGKFSRLWLGISVKYISPAVILLIFVSSLL
jgi:NSS family neurotransmitter:Na+ symporter